MTDRDRGVYILQLYADAAGVSRPKVLQDFISKYSDDDVAALGQVGNGINFSALKPLIQDIADATDPPSPPSRADLNQALLKVGGQKPSVVQDVIAGTSQAASTIASDAVAIGSASLSTLKWVAIAVVVLGGGYLAWQAGLLKRHA